jgi:hypothetical protein
MSSLPIVLDLFSGTGSATQPFVECGKHRVIRIDIAGKPDIRADVRHLPLKYGLRPEFVWASPPCDDFTDVPWHADLRDPVRGLALWIAARDWIGELDPPAWVMENVRGAQRFVGKATAHAGSRYLWTNLDLGPLPAVYGKWRLPPSPERKMLRSQIPRPLAEAVHRAVCPKEARSDET